MTTRTERQDEALLVAGAAAQRFALAWVGFHAALDELEAANRAARTLLAAAPAPTEAGEGV